ncbi:uncharacterized protein [Lepeophtheirus salmonis]|uniref:uncharacterized protein n=1 Tax=Lepeophtheirus salmonis TaxID=72036 RepID=UPI003AF33304
MSNQNKKDDDSYSNSHLFTVFKKFCESSTIHGTYFWTENTNNFWRFFWVGVVITGIVSSGFIINNSFKAWQETPVVTSVAQLAIEEIPFPSITICPLDNNRFGFVEEVIDESSDAQLNKGELLLDIFRLLRTHRFNVFSHSECLFLYCQSKTINADNDDCHQNIIKFEEFYFTMNSFVNDSARYDERIEGMMKDLIRDHFQEGVNEQNARIFSRDFEEGIECDSLVYDYLLLQNLKDIYESLEIKDLNPGKILKWIYYNTKDLKKQSQLMKKYLSPQLFPKAYARYFGANENIPFPDLVTILNGQFGEDSSLGPNFTFSDSLLKAMRSSNHPPHVYENGKFQPDPSMPLCNYAGELSEKATDARIRFCDAFQNTINEDGLCYSFNNNQLGMETLKSTGFYELRKVQGCGKIKGLQLAIDVNKLPYSIISNAQPKGFSDLYHG